MGRSISRRADDQQMGVAGPISAFVVVALATAAVMVGGSMEQSSATQPVLVADPVISATVPEPTRAPSLSAEEITELLPVSSLVSSETRDKLVASVVKDQEATSIAPTRVTQRSHTSPPKPVRSTTSAKPSRPAKGGSSATTPTRPAKADKKTDRDKRADKWAAKVDKKADRDKRKAEKWVTKMDKKADRDKRKADKRANKWQGNHHKRGNHHQPGKRHHRR